MLPDESTHSYFAALHGCLHEHGCPVAFYADKHSVFRVVRQDTKGGQGMTQFGRALSLLLSATARISAGWKCSWPTSEKIGYKNSLRAIYGPDLVEKTRSRAAVEETV